MPTILKKLKRSTSEGQESAVGEDDFKDCEDAVLHCDSHPDGGFGFTNKELLLSQRSAVMEVIKEAGKALLTGHLDLISLSLPVKMFEPRSYLEKLTDVWVFPRFLAEAAAATCPIQRLQLVATWFIAGQQFAFASWMKPFNPILGETFQAGTASGTRVYMEQISHHPPVSAYQLLGSGWTLEGLSRPEVHYKANAIKTVTRGSRSITFADGVKLHMDFPSYLLKGILYSEQPHGEMTGAFTVQDAAHHLQCQITFGKVPGKSHWLLQRPDAFSGQIVRLDTASAQAPSRSSSLTRLGSKFASMTVTSKSMAKTESKDTGEEVLSRCTGNWLSHVDWDGVRAFTLAEEEAEAWLPDPYPLPSDSRFRDDLAALLRRDLSAAQAAKEALEQRQRTDARWRRASSR